jgi:hypothetical protein
VSEYDADAFDAFEAEDWTTKDASAFVLLPYRLADGFEVPVAVKLASGRKP